MAAELRMLNEKNAEKAVSTKEHMKELAQLEKKHARDLEVRARLLVTHHKKRLSDCQTAEFHDVELEYSPSSVDVVYLTRSYIKFAYL